MADTLTVKTTDGLFEAYVARPVRKRAPAVVLIHEIFGVNLDLRQTADALARQGFIAVCPDLFWRQEVGVDLDPAAPDAFPRAVSLYATFDPDQGVRDIGATLRAVRRMPGSNGRVGLMGFCMGGLLTFLTTARIGDRACIAYYGGGTETHLGDAFDARTPVIMHLGEDDEYISVEARDRIVAAFWDSPHIQIFTYPGQGPAFARHRGRGYDAATARLANARAVSFFERQLGEG